MMMQASVLAEAYEAAMREDWEEMKKCYNEENYMSLGFSMTVNGDNAIHIAVFSKRKQPLQHFLDVLRKGDENLPAATIRRKNYQENTPLHKAALIGNYEAAKLLVQTNGDLLEMTNNAGETALFKAAWYGHTKVMKFLADQPGQMTHDKKLAMIHRIRNSSNGKPGASILHVTIEAEHFGTAMALLDLDETLAEADSRSDGLSSLQRMANLPHAFSSGYKMDFWKSILYFCKVFQLISQQYHAPSSAII